MIRWILCQVGLHHPLLAATRKPWATVVTYDYKCARLGCKWGIKYVQR